MELTGTIDSIQFRSDDSGFTVMTVCIEEDKTSIFSNKSDRFVKIVGVMPEMKVGMCVKAVGEMETTKWGAQLRVSEIHEIRPSDLEGIRRYLASGLIKNIGPVYAEKIVKTFGTRTLDVLDNHPEELASVHGIGKKRIRSIIESVREQKAIREIMVWLASHEVSNGLATKIWNKYGESAISVMEDNPYVLSDDIKGVGFKTADRVALAMGVEKESKQRIASGVHYVLSQGADNGNTCLPFDSVVTEAASEKVLGIDPGLVESELRDPSGLLISSRICEDNGMLYLKSYYYAEKSVAERLAFLSNRDDESSDADIDFPTLEQTLGVKYEEEQAEAIRLALTKGILILTGGPGTGKTVTTQGIITVLESAGKTVLLAAPTGRAAKRMSEVTHRNAMTIHRLLEWQGTFQRNSFYKLDGDALIIDESSMIDIQLMNALLDAVPDKMKVILVGDVDQLPSVGAGTVLHDIIDSGTVPTVRLRKIFRQAQTSDIIRGAHDINNRRIPQITNTKGTDLWLVSRDSVEEIATTVCFLVEKHIPKTFGIESKNIQVLTPMRREWDPIGAVMLNRKLQEELNSASPGLKRDENTVFRIGDKVMQIRNDYTKDVFNGDIGYVCSFDEDEETLSVMYDGEIIEYDKKELKDLELAYASTVHKSQGSEYPVVVMPLHKSQYILLQRNLLYTGVTRAKKLCVLVGTKEALAMAVAKEDTTKRYSLLKERLSGLL